MTDKFLDRKAYVMFMHRPSIVVIFIPLFLALLIAAFEYFNKAET